MARRAESMLLGAVLALAATLTITLWAPIRHYRSD